MSFARVEHTKFVKLQYIPCGQASERMLGIWMAPNGNKDKLIEKLCESATDLGVKVDSHPSRKYVLHPSTQTSLQSSNILLQHVL